MAAAPGDGDSPARARGSGPGDAAGIIKVLWVRSRPVLKIQNRLESDKSNRTSPLSLRLHCRSAAARLPVARRGELPSQSTEERPPRDWHGEENGCDRDAAQGLTRRPAATLSLRPAKSESPAAARPLPALAALCDRFGCKVWLRSIQNYARHRFQAFASAAAARAPPFDPCRRRRSLDGLRLGPMTCRPGGTKERIAE